MTARVARTQEVRLQPRAECLGDDPDTAAPSNCETTWDYGRGTLTAIKVHIEVNPTHQVLVVREIRSLYEARQ